MPKSKALHIYDVLRRPVITEKSHEMAEKDNHYVFEIDMRANKIQVREAIELIFDVDVVKVNTMVMPPKRGRRGRSFYVRQKAWKKAVISVQPGQTISLFNI
ncbi:MAG: 50S ribosomal protein L23 [Anaerolineae bacterium]|nr:50S ribosomal protein L23 [Anaerolineae bacterium]